MAKKEPETVSPPDWESLRLPNMRQLRYNLAQEADSLTREELERRAAEAGVDVSELKTKADVVEAVQDANTTQAVSPSVPEK